MGTTSQDRVRNTLKRVVAMLVVADHAGLEAMTGVTRLRREQIERGVAAYGKTLASPPDEAFDDIDAVEIEGTCPPACSIRFRLFTEEEGRSDLELQATFIDENPIAGEMRVELDNVIVA